MSIKTTPLFQCHKDLGAHMVEFAGTMLPVRYDSEKEEHLAVRNRVGMFDVSHMGEFFVNGEQAQEFLQYVLTNNIDNLVPNQAHYSLLLNYHGGIIDDLIVYKISNERFLLCVNAGNINKDWAWIKKQSENFKVSLENASDSYAQIALQGPTAVDLIQSLTPDVVPKRFHFAKMEIAAIECLVARTGYTGEDGVEIFLANKLAPDLWKILLSHDVKPCGLAARDSLRLEAGMLLHGTDMDEETSPLEARLAFAVAMNKNFIGKEALINQKQQGLKKKLIGFKLKERGIARHGFKILSKNNREIGEVTSGTWPPNHEHAIGLAYATDITLNNGDEIFVAIRQRLSPAIVAKPKFL